MAEQTAPENRAARPAISTRAPIRGASLYIILILFGSLFSACWVISHADSLTYDSVVFIRYARELGEAKWWTKDDRPAENIQQWLSQHSPLVEVIQRNTQHPGFAVLIATANSVISRIYADDSVMSWTRSAQIVSLLGLAVIVLAVYRLGCDLLNPAAGLMGAALVGFSPPIIRIGADALSDGPAVACMLLSGIFYCQSLRDQRLRPLLLGSIFAGAGYLIRPEAIQLALGMGAILFVLSLASLIRFSFRPIFRLAALALPLVLLVFPYSVVKGSALAKKSFLFAKSVVAAPAPIPPKSIDIPRAAVIHPASAISAMASSQAVEPKPTSKPVKARSKSTTARVIPAVKAADRRSMNHLLEAYGAGLVIFAKLWSSLAGYVFVLPLLLALVSGSIRLFSRSDHLLIIGAVFANFFGLPFVLYALCGYLDIRHVMPGFCLTAIWAWSGCLFFCHQLRDGLSACRVRLQGRAITWPCTAEFATICCIVPLIVSLGVAGARQPLNRPIAGLKSMGDQLQKELPADCDVIDPSFVSSFYAGLERENRWPYVGNFSIDGLQGTLERSGSIEFVILSDRLIAESTGRKSIPLTLGRWHLREWLTYPLSKDPACDEMIRTYIVERVESARLRTSSNQSRE